jgi:hypothetical protein
VLYTDKIQKMKKRDQINNHKVELELQPLTMNIVTIDTRGLGDKTKIRRPHDFDFLWLVN